MLGIVNVKESEYPHAHSGSSLAKKKLEGHEALNRSPVYIGQSQTFNFEI